MRPVSHSSLDDGVETALARISDAHRVLLTAALTEFAATLDAVDDEQPPAAS